MLIATQILKRTFLTLLLSLQASDASILTNGGLEALPDDLGTTKTVPTGTSYAWWDSVGYGDIEFDSMLLVPTAEGATCVDLNGIAYEGALSQTVITSPGTLYRLRFALSGNPGLPWDKNLGDKTLAVSWTGVEVSAFVFVHLPTDTQSTMRWEYHEVVVEGTGSDELVFASTTSTYHAAGPVIDDVSLTPIPIPQPILVNGGLEALPADQDKTKTVPPGSAYAGWASTGSGDVEFDSVALKPTAEGVSCVDLNGIAYEGTVSQALTTEPGAAYRLRFAMSGNPGVTWEPKLGDKSLDVVWSGENRGSFVFKHLPTDTQSTMRWEYHEVLVSGTGTDTLAFASTTSAYHDAGPVIDDISLTQVWQPAITVQPQPQTVHVGEAAIFTVTATGSLPLAYQWFFNGQEIPGATRVIFAVSDAQQIHAGEYSVMVSNGVGSTLSSTADLVVMAPPMITSQPTDLTVVQGDDADYMVASAGTPPLAYQWLFNDTPIPGAESPALTLTDVQAENAGVYRVEVSNPWGTVLSDPAELVVLVPPSIAAQPESRTVLVGTTASFAVLASGSEPLTFQWEFNGVPIPGEVGATLVLEAVQPEQAGEYAVVVSNAAGTITSSAVVLRVTAAAAEIRLVGGTVDNRTAVEVPVVLLANGDENALGLNVEFDPLLLVLTAVQKGADAQPGAILYNDSQVSGGRAGLALALPTDTTFAAGTREVFRLVFDVIAPHAPTQQVANLTFADTPTVTQLVGSDAAVLPARYVADSLIIRAAAYEGDIAPRPEGDQQLSVADWVQAGRFVAQLETPAEGSEFQRADCAPRATFGDGQISIIDWVQTGLYAAGLTPPTLGAGPMAKADGIPSPVPVPQNDANRVLRVVDAVINAGESSTVTILLEAEGGENALGFSLSFDPGKLTFLSATTAPGMDSATLNVNVAHQAEGRLGFALALPISEGMAAAAVDVLHLEFAATAGEHGTSTVAFGNDPVLREVSDTLANPLLTTYIDGTVTVVADRPVLEIRWDNGSLLLAWPAAADTFVVEGIAAEHLGSNDWGIVVLEVEELNGERVASLPVTNGTMLYRLKQP